MPAGAWATVVGRSLLTALAAVIGVYGMAATIRNLARAVEYGWPSTTTGTILGAALNIAAGIAIGYAAWRPLKWLPSVLSSAAVGLSLAALMPWIIRDTGPLLDLPGYGFVIGVYLGIGGPVIPLGFVLAAVGLRLHEDQRPGKLEWLAIASVCFIVVWFVVWFATAPET